MHSVDEVYGMKINRLPRCASHKAPTDVLIQDYAEPDQDGSARKKQQCSSDLLNLLQGCTLRVVTVLIIQIEVSCYKC